MTQIRVLLAEDQVMIREALAALLSFEDDPALTLLSGTFDPDAEAALAWCLREAVTNVIRHSGAKNCHVSLTRQPDILSLEVRDDGVGLRSGDYDGRPSMAGSGAQTPGVGAGLHGMSERLVSVGGRLELRPSSRGFCLVATVPVRDGVSVTT